jgi:small ligand-binding sensory domain FIST
MKWTAVASQKPDLVRAVDACLDALAAEHGDAAPDLLFAFVSAHHAAHMDKVPGLLRGRWATPPSLLGCSGAAVIGSGHEIEGSPGVSLVAATLPGVRITPFHLSEDQVESMRPWPGGLAQALGIGPHDNPSIVLLADGFSFDVQRLLSGMHVAFPDGVVFGGLASGGSTAGSNTLFCGDGVFAEGCAGVVLSGNIACDTLVAQGCRPVGAPAFVTRSHRNMMLELDSRPPAEFLQALYDGLEARDKRLFASSLFLGVVMDDAQERYQQGDYLIRNILGIDPNSGALAVGALLRPNQVVQFHLRDARTASEDLAILLERYRRTHEDDVAPSGALLFSCLGRGKGLYGKADHDTAALAGAIGPLPLGGFFCNGEVGPVHDRSFLHGFTSVFALFRPRGVH